MDNHVRMKNNHFLKSRKPV